MVSDDADRMNSQYFKCKVTQACGLRKYNINGTHWHSKLLKERSIKLGVEPMQLRHSSRCIRCLTCFSDQHNSNACGYIQSLLYLQIIGAYVSHVVPTAPHTLHVCVSVSASKVCGFVLVRINFSITLLHLKF